MTAWKVCAIVLAVLILISLIRVGGGAEYSADGLRAWVRLGRFRIGVYPLKPKADKPPKEKKPEKGKQGKEPAESEKKGGSLDLVLRLLPLAGEAAGELKRRIRIDTLTVHVTSGGEDPAAAAMAYGYASAAMGMIWPIFEQNFEVKDHDLGTAVDFNADKPAVYLKAALSARVGQLVSFAVRYGLKFLKVYRSGKKPAKKQKEAI